MRGIDLRLAFAASAALAVSLLILVTINSITTDELVRRVKAGQISSITVMGDHAVATTVDNDLITFTVVRGASVFAATPEPRRHTG